MEDKREISSEEWQEMAEENPEAAEAIMEMLIEAGEEISLANNHPS